jgi:hypothetical protein
MSQILDGTYENLQKSQNLADVASAITSATNIGLITSVGTPGVDTSFPSEKAVRSEITESSTRTGFVHSFLLMVA